MPGHERCRLAIHWIIDLRAVAALQLKNVTKTAGRDEPGRLDLALENRVQADRRAVHEELYLSNPVGERLKGIKETLSIVARSRRCFVKPQLGSLVIEEDRVSKSSA